MGEFEQTSLLILAASIGTSDPWVMCASSGVVTLTPYRMMSDYERLQSAEQRALLCLSDLGHLDGAADGTPSLVRSPLRARADVVLLLPWSLLSTVAELDAVARTTTQKISSNYAPEDWRPAWHHFVAAEDWEPLAEGDDATRRAAILSRLPFTGTRHFVLASSAMANLASSGRPAGVLDAFGAAGRREHAVRGAERDVDPMVFTNPGGAPEGLSPLFKVPFSA